MDLPQELIRLIAEYSDESARKNLRIINKLWFKTVLRKHYDFYLLNNGSFPQIIQRLSQYSHPLSISINKSRALDWSILLEHLTKLSGLTALKLNSNFSHVSPSCTELLALTKLSQLHSIYITKISNVKHRQREDELQALLPNLRSVAIGYVPYFDEYSACWYYDDEYLDQVQMNSSGQLSIASLSRLENLSLFLVDVSKMDLTLALHLTSLHIDRLVQVKEYPMHFFTKLEELTVYVLRGQELFLMERMCNLKSLEIDNVDSNFDMNTLKAMTRLEKLIIQSMLSEQNNLSNVTNFKQLTQLYIMSDNGKHIIGDEMINMEDMVHLRELTTNSAVRVGSAVKINVITACSSPWKGSTQIRSFTMHGELSKFEPQFPNLESLTLGPHCDFNPSNNNGIGVDRLMNMIGQLSHLTSLKILPFFPRCRSDYLAGLPLKVLDYNGLDDDVLSKLTALESLCLYSSSNDAIASLASHSKLTRIRIFATRLEPNVLTAIAKLTNIRELICTPTLDENKDNNDMLDQLAAHLPQLQSYNNRLSLGPDSESILDYF